MNSFQVSRCRLGHYWFALMVALMIAGPSAVAQEGGAKQYAKEFHHDFRGKPLPPELAQLNVKEEPVLKLEPQGLRITIPKEWKHPFGGVGVKTTFGIQGDFEITTTYEILEAEAPTKGYGVGVCLRVSKSAPSQELANLCRAVRPEGKPIVFWERLLETTPGAKPQYPNGGVAGPEKTGRLRMKRTGTTLSFLRASGSEEDFQEIGKQEFGGDEIKAVALVGLTGREPYKLDARFLDLRIRSGGELPALATTSDKPAIVEQKVEPKGGLAALMIVGLAGILLLLVALGAGLFLLRRRGVGKIEMKAAASFACPNCGKNLKVKPELAGMRIKCSACGKAVHVPA